LSRRLAPVNIADRLFGIPPDRDEKASQLCAEALLTLVQNRYAAPETPDGLVTPKRGRWALRSLALSENFLAERDEGRAGAADMTPERYGELLKRGEDFRASANLQLAKRALEGLIDPSTHTGQPGGWLLMPFHESLLWYDARQQRARPWGVRKVYMRGSGITLARMLADPLPGLEHLGTSAVEAIRDALTEPSPLADIAEHLESALGDEDPPRVEDDEKDAWMAGASEKLQELADRLCRHCEGVMAQGSASGPAKLWQVRTIFALDLAVHALECAWDATETADARRHLLLSFGGARRAENRVRQQSEGAYRQARILIREATVVTLVEVMRELRRRGGPPTGWNDEFEPRALSKIGHVAEELASARPSDLERLAREAAEGANYDRTGDGFRVLLESIGMLAGTGLYRFLTAGPELLSAMVGALSASMPMTSDDFWKSAFAEWRVVVSADQLQLTNLDEHLDGADLVRNAARAESILVEAGLAIALSDRTTIVGERARRSA
jgi:hypothetical protein